MFCPKCGNPLPANARFCPLCGVAVRSNVSPGMESPLGSASFGTSDNSETAYNASNPYASSSAPDPYAPSDWSEAANVPDYLIWNVLSTLFCCPPLGVAGIIFSIQTNSAKTRCDFEAAKRHSSTAKTLLVVGAVVGGLQILLSLVWIVLTTAVEIGSLGAL
ncbi:MAG: CD225/dispanin family protein [Thermoguttaceae bacterium]|nr:CD225/dispanin family protein [Thermoguttaceae bacterium]MBQ7029974.1 CD225/dispanin family protein [Thermoguttaceae bacterium]